MVLETTTNRTLYTWTMMGGKGIKDAPHISGLDDEVEPKGANWQDRGDGGRRFGVGGGTLRGQEMNN